MSNVVNKGNRGLRHAALDCTDLDRAFDFYCTKLDFSPYYRDADWAMLSFEETYLSLLRVDHRMEQGAGSGKHRPHLGFVFGTREEVDARHARFQQEGMKVGKLTEHRDGSVGFYFSDPDGNTLECIFIPQAPQAKS